jgi:hypothetical protein
MVAASHRHKMATSAPTVDILSNPVLSVKQRAIAPRPKFEETCFHRDYVVTRCHVPMDIRKQHVDVRRAAAEQSMKRERELRERERVLEQLKAAALVRCKEANKDVVMVKVSSKLYPFSIVLIASFTSAQGHHVQRTEYIGSGRQETTTGQCRIVCKGL